MVNMESLLQVLLILSAAVLAQGFEMKYGQLKFETSGEFGCTTTTLTTPFSSSGVKVQVAMYNYLDDVKPTYEAGVAWVEDVSAGKFTACVRISGPCCPSSSSGKRAVGIPYVAYTGSPSRGLDGSVNVPLWTTGTKCVTVPLSGMTFTAAPFVYATAVHSITQNRFDAASLWIEAIALDSFKLCLRELKNFDGVHKSIKVNWMALQDIPSEMADIMPIQDKLVMPNSALLGPETHYSFCKSVNFSSPFYATPHVVTSASHVTDPLNVLSLKPEHNAITEWVEDISTTSFRVCMKDLQPYDKHHDPVTISYMTIGNLHPCLPVTCKYFAKCVAYSAKEAVCECDDDCPTFENPMCGSNGKTYKNRCAYELDYCRNKGNFTIVHMGSCVIPYVLHRGRVTLRLDTTEVQCEPVTFKTSDLDKPSPIHVQTSINYFNESGIMTHDAAVTWVEKITSAGFSVCVLKAGRNDRMLALGDYGLTFVDYIAYQGAPVGAVAGEQNITQWWEGTTCSEVNLPAGKFTGTPHILATAEHGATDLKHDAATVWIENPSASKFKLCLRELQDFDGLHKDINVNWIAYESLPSALMSERQLLLFPNSEAPLDRDHHAFCKDMAFTFKYTRVPTVIISASHSTGVGRLEPDFNSVAVWLEDISTSLCRICIKELHTPTGNYDPVLVSTLVIGQRV